MGPVFQLLYVDNKEGDVAIRRLLIDKALFVMLWSSALQNHSVFTQDSWAPSQKQVAHVLSYWTEVRDMS